MSTRVPENLLSCLVEEGGKVGGGGGGGKDKREEIKGWGKGKWGKRVLVSQGQTKTHQC